jgi:hypothetical protein
LAQGAAGPPARLEACSDDRDADATVKALIRQHGNEFIWMNVFAHPASLLSSSSTPPERKVPHFGNLAGFAWSDLVEGQFGMLVPGRS